MTPFFMWENITAVVKSAHIFNTAQSYSKSIFLKEL